MALNYPGIERACLEVALDNGGINRTRSVKQQQREFDRWMEKQDFPNLRESDEYFSSLSDEDLQTVCSGGEDEPETVALRAHSPTFVDDLLNSYFDEVC